MSAVRLELIEQPKMVAPPSTLKQRLLTVKRVLTQDEINEKLQKAEAKRQELTQKKQPASERAAEI